MKIECVSANDTDFSYLECGTGKLALLLHGFPDTAQTWRHLMPQLADMGYRVVAVLFKEGQPVADHVFAEGWLRPDRSVTGRPVDLLQMPDGALLVSDDTGGVIYRISYQP